MKKMNKKTAAGMTLACSMLAGSLPALAASEGGDLITLTGAISLESIETTAIKTDPVSDYIRERFGIQFEVVSDCSGNSWNEKFPVSLAAKDLPDVFMLVQDPVNGYSGTIQKLIDADAIVCLDDYPELFEEYNSDPILANEMDYVRTFVSPDGRSYCFPMYFGESNYAKGLVNTIALRWDCYSAVGYPEFANYDELADVLKQMQDVAPPDANGNHPYAVSGWFAEGSGWGDWEMLYSYGQSVATTSSAMQFHGEKSISEINKYTSTESPFYEYLRFLNKCNRLGILDPDSFTMTWDEYNAAIENGSILYISAGWLTDQKNAICADTVGDEMAGFVHMPAPADYADNYSGGNWDWGLASAYCISSKCENIEAAIELLCWISGQEGSLIMENGPEGLAWEYDENGIPVGHEDYLKMGQFDSESYRLYGSNLYHHLKGYSDATPLSKFGGVTANLRLSDKATEISMTPYEKDAMEHFGAESFVDEKWLNRANTTFTANLISAIGSVPDEYMMANANLNDYMYTTQFEVILAPTEEEAEALIQEMIEFAKENKADEIQQYFIDAQSEYLETLLPICDNISAALQGE